MTEINPNEVHAATAELTSDAALRLVRNGVAQERASTSSASTVSNYAASSP